VGEWRRRRRWNFLLDSRRIAKERWTKAVEVERRVEREEIESDDADEQGRDVFLSC